jgi:hypothetical protein
VQVVHLQHNCCRMRIPLLSNNLYNMLFSRNSRRRLLPCQHHLFCLSISAFLSTTSTYCSRISIQFLSSDFERTKFHRSQAKLFKSEIVNKSSFEVRQGTRTTCVERHFEILQSRVRRQYWAILLPKQKFLELFERQTKLDGQVSEITLSTAGANLEECQIGECEI